MPYVKAKDGVEIYYEVSGQGTPLLFLSETACDGAVWNLYQIPEFARDHRVVIFDYRGTGLSGKPSLKYSTTVFADALEFENVRAVNYPGISANNFP
jgi:pimeloyl-ACP methyl ester carboxylesterase